MSISSLCPEKSKYFFSAEDILLKKSANQFLVMNVWLQPQAPSIKGEFNSGPKCGLFINWHKLFVEQKCTLICQRISISKPATSAFFNFKWILFFTFKFEQKNTLSAFRAGTDRREEKPWENYSIPNAAQEGVASLAAELQLLLNPQQGKT